MSEIKLAALVTAKHRPDRPDRPALSSDEQDLREKTEHAVGRLTRSNRPAIVRAVWTADQTRGNGVAADLAPLRALDDVDGPDGLLQKSPAEEFFPARAAANQTEGVGRFSPVAGAKKTFSTP